MSECSVSKNKRELTREAIIGLGEASFRKNYYTELQNKISVLELSNIRNRALITTIPDILMVSNISGDISLFSSMENAANPLAQAILADQMISRQLQAAIRDTILKRELVTCNFVLEHQSHTYFFEARIHVSEIDEVLIMIRDMTERIMLENKLRELADLDGLTRLYNRRYFEDRLAEYDGRCIQNFTIILIDINGLKIINDTLGHLAGDKIIIAVANILNQIFERIGYVARVGGDEFGIILHGYNVNGVESKIEQMMQAVESYNASTETLKLSISSGYACSSSNPINIHFMYQEADNNMYQNKLLKESSTRNGIVKTLMKALEARDYITEGHTRRLETLAMRMGQILKLSQSKMDRIKLLANFHDIGKVGIPDCVLTKPTSLTEEEWKVMQSHSNIGKRIAETSPELKDISRLILMHHEKWDGTGYPLGMKGLEIPIECRILSIVDAFDAMTNDRPYRKALSREKALEIIRDGAGHQFDGLLVDLFFEMLKKYPVD